MYFTDAGIEELDDRRGDEQVTMAWLAERLRDFVDLNPEFETAVDRLASWLARIDTDGDADADADTPAPAEPAEPADEELQPRDHPERVPVVARRPRSLLESRGRRAPVLANAIHLDFAATRYIVVHRSMTMYRDGGPRWHAGQSTSRWRSTSTTSGR